MAEEMRFDSRQTESEPIFTDSHRLGVRKQGRAGSLVDAPDARGRHVNAGIRIAQAPVIRIENVAAFGLREKSREGAPRFGKHPTYAIEEPIDLFAPAQKDAAQHQPNAPLRVGLG